MFDIINGCKEVALWPVFQDNLKSGIESI